MPGIVSSQNRDVPENSRWIGTLLGDQKSRSVPDLREFSGTSLFCLCTPACVDKIGGVGVRSNGGERRLISSGIQGETQMAETTVKGFFEGLSDKLNAKPEKVAGLNCVYQFHVTDAAWTVKLTDGKVAVAEGEAPSPNCTITMAEGDFLDLISGKLNGQMAFLTGKLKVTGDMGLALKLGSFIG